GKFDDASKTSKTFGDALDGLSTTIENLDFGHLFSEIDRYIKMAGDAKFATENWARELGRLTGLDAVGEFLGNNSIANSLGITSSRALDRRMGGGVPGADTVIQDWARRNYGSTATTQKTGRLPAAASQVDPVSLADYKVPGKD